MDRNQKIMLAGIFVVCFSVIGGLVYVNLAQHNFILKLQEQFGAYEVEAGGGYGIEGYWEFYRNGVLVYSCFNNLTTAGANQIRDMIANSSETENHFTYIAIGTGSGGDYTSTALVTEFNRTSATYTEPGAQQFRLEATFIFSSSGAITEAGCFDASSGGTLLNYQDFSAISLDNGDELTVRFTFTIAGP